MLLADGAISRGAHTRGKIRAAAITQTTANKTFKRQNETIISGFFTEDIDSMPFNDKAPVQRVQIKGSGEDRLFFLGRDFGAGQRTERAYAGTEDGVPVTCGGADDSLALGAAVRAARNGWVLIGPGQTCAGRDINIENLHISKGGLLKPIASHTITISGSFEAGAYQTFTNALPGQGTISFAGNKSMVAVYPQWWGARADASTDCTGPIQSAINAAGSVGQGAGDLESLVLFASGIYLTGNLEIDRGAAEINNRIGLIGSGTRSTVLRAKPGTSQLLRIQGKDPDHVNSGTLIRDLQFQGNQLAVPLVKMKNVGFSRLENVTFQDNRANALTLERVHQTTFDQLYFANVGGTGSRNGVILIDTGSIDAGSELRFRDIVIEAFVGRGIEFVQSSPSRVSTYQVVFDNLKIEDGGDGRPSAGGDYQVILENVDHIKFQNSFFASKALGRDSNTLQNAQIYVAADVRDLVFSNTVFFNNADLNQPTAITSYVYIDGNKNGVRFISPLFRETHFRQSYCIYAQAPADNIVVIAPEFINWSFNPTTPQNVAFSNSTSKVSVFNFGSSVELGTRAGANGAPLNQVLSGTTESIGGSVRASSCLSGTANVPGTSTSMVAIASPAIYQGAGIRVSARVSSPGVVTVYVCSDTGAMAIPSTYAVRVLP